MVNVSVVIANYKKQDGSLDCILSQSMKDIEVIFPVPECDKDSLNELKEIAKEDNRIKIVKFDTYQKVVPLDVVLCNACGEFVYFFTPGESITENVLEELYDNAAFNESDIVLFKVFDDNANEYYMDLSESLSDDAVFDFNQIRECIFKPPFILSSKLYKKEFLKENGFKFDKSTEFYDIIFHMHTLIKAERISYCDSAVLNHNFECSNLVENSNGNEMDIFYTNDHVESVFKKERMFIPFEIELNDFLMRSVDWFLISSGSPEYYKKARRQFSLIKYGLVKILPEDLFELYNLVMDNKSYDKFKQVYKSQ